jgi:PAS domain S-box-containing protein
VGKSTRDGGISPALASALLDFVCGAIVLADEDGQIVLASAMAQRFVRRNQADLAGVSLDELIPDCVAALQQVSATHADHRAGYLTRLLHVDGELVPAEVALTRVPDGGIIAFALSIRDARVRAGAGVASLLGRYDAFLEEMSRFITRGAGSVDRVDGLAALIAAGLEVSAVAVVVFVAEDEPIICLHGFPETIARALVRCFAAQTFGSDLRPLLLKDMNEQHRPFALAVQRAEFRDAVVVKLSMHDQALGLLTALSRTSERFDGPAQHFLARAGTLLVRAIPG